MKCESCGQQAGDDPLMLPIIIAVIIAVGLAFTLAPDKRPECLTEVPWCAP